MTTTLLMALLVTWSAVVALLWRHRKERLSETLPSWAVPASQWGGGTAVEHHALNVRDTEAANRQGRTFDVVVYGDSITAGIRDLSNMAWSKIMFTPFFSGLDVAAFGAPGNVVEDLAWRLMSGKERPRKDPRVVVLWIGTNNIGRGTDPTKRLEFLVTWMKRTMRRSSIVILSLLPRAKFDTRPTNREYKAIAARVGVTYLECGANLNPSDKGMFMDGLHLTPQGYAVVMKCLAKQVRALLGTKGAPRRASDPP